MATCPRCGEFLDEHHHCTGLWRRRVSSATGMLVGAAVSLVALYAVSDNPSNATVAIGVVAGVILGHAVWSALFH
jgi:hypothetical protein